MPNSQPNDTRTPKSDRRSSDGEKSSPRPDKAGTGSPEKSGSTTGGGSPRISGNDQGASQRTHKHGRAAESGSSDDDERRPESERLRASDGPAEAARAHARERVPYRDGPAAQDPERAAEQVRQTHVEEQRDLERTVRKDDE